jgi:hypothetical protein
MDITIAPTVQVPPHTGDRQPPWRQQASEQILATSNCRE